MIGLRGVGPRPRDWNLVELAERALPGPLRISVLLFRASYLKLRECRKVAIPCILLNLVDNQDL